MGINNDNGKNKFLYLQLNTFTTIITNQLEMVRVMYSEAALALAGRRPAVRWRSESPCPLPPPPPPPAPSASAPAVTPAMS